MRRSILAPVIPGSPQTPNGRASVAQSCHAGIHTVDVLGVDVFAGTFDDAVTTLIERAGSREGGYVVQCNVHVLMTAQKDVTLMRALRAAWLAFPDGAPISWLQRRLGERSAQRVAGPDLMSAVIDRGRADGLRHFFIGSTPEVLEVFVSRLTKRFPGVEIGGVHSPPFGPCSELGDVAALACTADPHVVWVALGAPKQELWMHEHGSELPRALVCGVGAAVDFHAGVSIRAPMWVQRFGFEWAHRLAHEPRRLLGRYVRSGSTFVYYGTRFLARRGRQS
jgi:N-acetylglucosaminyldiphosphoundecaprenol N-acetyl-beta-D-mannosaminyltransferase